LKSASSTLRADQVLAKTGKLVIGFTNNGNVAADIFRFRIGSGASDAAFIRDQDKFSHRRDRKA
jgi:hypothetical protein